MARTAVLRFSDVEEPSVAVHEAARVAYGYVWWGWWKKQTEPFAKELLEHVRTSATEAQPLRVGLLNRKDSQYFAADCVGVEFAVDGQPIPCPEPEKCPAYYAAQYLPAWFKFRSFDKLDESRYRLEFGTVPQLDPTLYDVVRTQDGIEILPKPMWTMEAHGAPGRRILHLTDLHFGSLHGFPESGAGAGPGQRSLRTTLVERLARIGGERIGVVVVSGDLVSRGEYGAFPAAKEMIEGVLDVLGLEREHVVIVPGNHDIWLEGVDHPTRDYAHEKPYREFLEGFYRRDIQDLEWIQRYEVDDWDLTFFTLNSARLRSEAMKDYGYVGLHRYQQMLDFVLDTLGVRPSLERRQLLVGVVHHHLLPVPLISVPEYERPVSLTLDAGQLLQQFQHFGVQVVLHGHQHVPFLGRVTPNQVAARRTDSAICVIGGGSAGAGRDALLEEAPYNTYAIYDPVGQGLRVLAERYTPNSQAELLVDRVVPIS